MTGRNHKAARHRFAQLIKEAAEGGGLDAEILARLSKGEDGPELYVLEGKTPRRVRDLLQWAVAFERSDVLARDIVGRAVVSTIFLGINSSILGPPLLFETMVFGGKHDMAQNRYETYDEAMAGHQWWLAKVTKSEGS
jgi:hypothetical protein